MIKKVETSQDVQNLWQKIVEAIKLFCEKHLGVESDKSVDNIKDLSNKQARGAKAIVGKFSDKIIQEAKGSQQMQK